MEVHELISELKKYPQNATVRVRKDEKHFNTMEINDVRLFNQEVKHYDGVHVLDTIPIVTIHFK